ncbi:MAG TPA: hypothetical protein VMC84_07415 [Methanocella sp.]|nr:hypothetical protein [Methanocella sp.]HTY90987.1 hypothetical protein [Methanocella sp.]
MSHMGLLDFFKPKRIPPPKVDDLFKLSPVAVTMGQLNVEPSGKAGVCFHSTGDIHSGDMKSGIIKVLENTAFLASYKVTGDQYGFTWVLIDSDTLANAVSNVYLASQLLIEGGFSDHITAAIFRFEQGDLPVYWIYNYRRAAFYPFAPRGNERDSQLEYRLRLLVMEELPMDSLDYWFPIWGIPF